MKIEKLPSGSYRVRKTYKGKMYSITFEYKPTQKEAIEEMAKRLSIVRGKNDSLTFEAASREYIEAKRNVLSPSTIRGYMNVLKGLSASFVKINVHDVTEYDVQRQINALSKDHTPKTVRNYHGFISAVLGMFNPNLKLNTTLPQKVKNEPYIPSDEDVRKILDASAGTRYEIPLVLACYGMRRSEIAALTTNDIDGDVVRINKALVQDENEEWVEKKTKTTASTREIVIPTEIAEKIKKQGYVYNGSLNSITYFLQRTQDSLGIPRFSIHKMRHYFASKMSALNIPEADILKMGGWSSDHVMKSVYRHSMMDKEEQSKREAAERLRGVIFSEKS